MSRDLFPRVWRKAAQVDDVQLHRRHCALGVSRLGAGEAFVRFDRDFQPAVCDRVGLGRVDAAGRDVSAVCEFVRALGQQEVGRPSGSSPGAENGGVVAGLDDFFLQALEGSTASAVAEGMLLAKRPRRLYARSSSRVVLREEAQLIRVAMLWPWMGDFMDRQAGAMPVIDASSGTISGPHSEVMFLVLVLSSHRQGPIWS